MTQIAPWFSPNALLSSTRKPPVLCANVLQLLRKRGPHGPRYSDHIGFLHRPEVGAEMVGEEPELTGLRRCVPTGGGRWPIGAVPHRRSTVRDHFSVDLDAFRLKPHHVTRRGGRHTGVASLLNSRRFLFRPLTYGAGASPVAGPRSFALTALVPVTSQAQLPFPRAHLQSVTILVQRLGPP